MLDHSAEDQRLDGLVLLDLPDHDSTEVSHHLEMDRLIKYADLLVWVLDPQKYADAAIHDRYIRPMRIERPGASDRRTRISYSGIDRPCAARRSRSRRSIRTVVPPRNERHTRCCSAVSQGVAVVVSMTGARITSTLINSLQHHDKQFGVETMCVGGGQGMF